MRYNIRQMEIDDIDNVIESENKIFGDSLGSDMLYTELKCNPYAFYFVLEVNKKFAGYIGTWIEEEHSEIINFLVLEEYQGNGFGSMMLDFVINLVKSVNVPNISLEVRKSNEKAIKLYEKYGFKYSHTREKYYKNGEDALVLILEVTK